MCCGNDARASALKCARAALIENLQIQLFVIARTQSLNRCDDFRRLRFYFRPAIG